MKKLLAVFLLVCIFLTPALTSSAAAHNYDYVYTDVNVITPDSFEDVFSATKIDRAAFTYEMAVLNSAKAAVAMEFEIKVGFEYYTAIVSGVVPAIPLPSGEVLYEGPISGNMTVGEDEYRATVGFIKLASSDAVMLSVTLQSDSDLVAFSFGENIIQGEVLNLFCERANQVQNRYDNCTENIDLSDDIEQNILGNISTPLVKKPFDQVILDGGDGYSSLGPNGEWVFKDAKSVTHDNILYTALKSRIYWNRSENNLLVMLEPFCDKTQNYIDSTHPNNTGVSLYSFSVRMDINNYDIGDYGKIKDVVISNRGEYDEGYYDDQGRAYLLAFFLDLITLLHLPTNLIEAYIEDLKGDIDITNNSSFATVNVHIDQLNSLHSDVLDDADQGLPFEFLLEKKTQNDYLGQTNYTVCTSVKYVYFVELGLIPIPYYIEKNITQNGLLTIQ